MNVTDLRATMAVVDAEEMDGRDLAGAFRARGRTTTDLIASACYEPWYDGHGVLHLPPPPDLRSEPIADSLVVLPHALLPHRHRHRRTIQRWHRFRLHRRGNLRHQNRGNVTGAVAHDGDVARATCAPGVFRVEYGREA